MAIVTVEVTQEDIDKGQTSLDARIMFCPLYLGCKRAIPETHHVNQKHIVVGDYPDVEHIELPPPALQLMRMADRQANVKAGRLKVDPNDVDQEPLKPITFTVHIPEKTT